MTKEEAKQAPEAQKMSLAIKLAKIGKEIGKVEKTGKNNSYNGYSFIEYGVVAGKIREKFDEYNVIIIPAVTDYKSEIVTSKNGGCGYHYILQMSFSIINGDDPKDTMTFPWLGEAADYGDKGINKAETSATKYFLMRLFNISERGDEDADSQSPEYSHVENQPSEDQPHVPVKAIIQKIRTLGSIAEVNDAARKIAEKYPLIKSIDSVLIDRAIKQRKEDLSAVDPLPSDEEIAEL